jgi:hypothetical protein
MAVGGPADELLQRILAAVASGDVTPQVRRMVTEARAEAEAEVKAVVKTAVKALLLRRTVEALESDVAREGEPVHAAEAAAPPLPPEPAPDAPRSRRLDALATTMDDDGRESDATPPPIDPHSSTACYVYAITAAGDDAWVRDVPAIDSAFPLRVVRHDDVQAVVSDVSLDEFQQASLERRATQPEWIEAKVRAHDDVIRAAMECGAAIPCRFCTVLRSDGDVRRLLSVHAGRVAGTLAELDGKEEWGVKMYAVPVRESVGADVAAGGGKAYLERRRSHDARRGELDREARAHAKACHEEIAAVAAGAVVLPRRPGVASANGSDVPLLNGAYLVPRETLDDFHALVAAMRERHGPLGLAFEVTGPWPPYNFVHLDLSLEAAA